MWIFLYNEKLFFSFSPIVDVPRNTAIPNIILVPFLFWFIPLSSASDKVILQFHRRHNSPVIDGSKSSKIILQILSFDISESVRTAIHFTIYIFFFYYGYWRAKSEWISIILYLYKVVVFVFFNHVADDSDRFKSRFNKNKFCHFG